MRSRLLLVVVAVLVLPLAACGGSAQEPARAETVPSGERRLIGYQVKRLDQLIESTFDRLLAEAGVSRRQWQTLNTIGAGPVDDAGLADALRPFWEVNHENLEDVIADSTAQGWVDREPDGHYVLTDAGRAVHAAAADSVGRIRELSAAGISEAEFDRAMDVIQRLIGNLERAGS